jgi:hypothetical protein
METRMGSRDKEQPEPWLIAGSYVSMDVCVFDYPQRV